ncbi:hypothetical protein LJC09_00860 [Desulfovibrio sp. OttesenSCG-928-F20]|nr:hypothetical protein [Desulfovibrio sp. OttesenSCG-928-M16]MDL2290643.1 hypothetical protein [Desulfovibrio sp. OttesenSCG-928-F20]
MRPLYLCLLLLSLCWQIPTPAFAAKIPGREVAGLVAARALRPPDAASLEALAATQSADEMNAVLQSFDRYAFFRERASYERLLKAQGLFPASVGMDIVHDRKQRIVCIPYPGSRAARAGVRYGDELLAVDGQRVLSSDLEDVAVLVRGAKNSTVKLLLRDAGGQERNISVMREIAAPPTVTKGEAVHGMPCVAVLRFGPGTAKELKSALDRALAGGGKALVLDLRGNTGGDLAAGLEAARLFLPANSLMVRIRSPKGESLEQTSTNGSYAFVRLYIWQDGLTASAAEMLITALKGARRAAPVTTIGGLSAGKAQIQEQINLAGGNLLKLSTRQMFTAYSMRTWQDVGLMPDIPAFADMVGDRVQFLHFTPPGP